MKKLYLSLVCAIALASVMGTLSSCSSDEPVSNNDEPTQGIEEPIEDVDESETYSQPTSPEFDVTRSERTVNNNINDFGLQLFNAVSATPDIVERYPNFAVSPVSMAFTLAMCANLGDDNLKADILAALDCESIDVLNELCRKLMMYLPDPSNKCELSLANAMWCDNGLAPTASCRTAIKDNFFGNISSLDFSNPFYASEVINKWAARSTKDIIDNVITPAGLENTKVLLANALYFGAQWSAPFQKSKTVSRVFHGTAGDRDFDFMCDKREMGYVSCERFEAVILGYEGTSYMIAVLPSEELNIDEFCSSFNSADLDIINSEKSTYLVELSFPKFESEIKTPLGDVVNNLGIGLGRSHLSGIIGADEDVFLTVGHTAKVSTDEEGTIAAAVSIGEMSICPLPEEIQGEVTLSFDRPFIYFIKNYNTGSILMAGCVRE